MKKDMINSTHIEGILYSHNLVSKVTGDTSKNPGTSYINGTIDIATDDAHTNVVSIHFSYVTPTYSKSGKDNPNYSILNKIITGEIKTVADAGWEGAARLRVDSAIGLNEFYSDRDGEPTLVSTKRNEGGFVHLMRPTDVLDSNEKNRSTFKADMVITSVTVREADPEKDTPETCVVKGCIFDFRKAILPVEFTATHPGAINYFVSLDASPKSPIFTTVWGVQTASTVKRTITEESAFGDPSIREVTTSRREFVITGAKAEVYEWDSEDTIAASELKDLMSEREIYLATLKKNQDEWKAKAAEAKATPVGTSEFAF